MTSLTCAKEKFVEKYPSVTININHNSENITMSLKEEEIHEKILQLVYENNSKPNGITKTELARVFTERWGTSRTTIWDYMVDLIDSGKIELRRGKKRQHALFIGKRNF